MEIIFMARWAPEDPALVRHKLDDAVTALGAETARIWRSAGGSPTAFTPYGVEVPSTLDLAHAAFQRIVDHAADEDGSPEATEAVEEVRTFIRNRVDLAAYLEELELVDMDTWSDALVQDTNSEWDGQGENLPVDSEFREYLWNGNLRSALDVATAWVWAVDLLACVDEWLASRPASDEAQRA
ncbi:hypothetical protein [Demequina iriomotensis]|uniref:hypothetical protein n=1 Tax=Demequina iriomotensis TaxID=1536641 RepID=UPI000781B44B|nr:hypothetical protein [Demequina iriomotensis]